MKTLKITLDTNCIINLLDTSATSRTSVEDLSFILGMAQDKHVEIFVTTRFQADQAQDQNMSRVIEIASRLQQLPVETVGSVFRLDISLLDGGDVLGDEEIKAINGELIQLLAPSGLDAAKKTFLNTINDIDHLLGHYINCHDIFVTDDKNILKKADQLHALLGITVMSPYKIAQYIKQSIAEALQLPLAVKRNETYISRPGEGKISFNYSNNNGRFIIGQGIYSFETAWSKASDTHIHAYSDGENVESIALAKNLNEIPDVADFEDLDYSSRSRSIGIGEVLVVKNRQKRYAALLIEAIEDDTRGATEDLIKFKYKLYNG